MKHIHVSCGIIEREGMILSAKRSFTMSNPLKWEFPGGKINEGESPEACLIRELNEELGISVAISNSLPQTTHSYPAFTITLYPFICRIESGTLTLKEHADAMWLHPYKLKLLNWAEADIPVVHAYLEKIGM